MRTQSPTSSYSHSLASHIQQLRSQQIRYRLLKIFFFAVFIEIVFLILINLSSDQQNNQHIRKIGLQCFMLFFLCLGAIKLTQCYKNNKQKFIYFPQQPSTGLQKQSQPKSPVLLIKKKKEQSSENISVASQPIQQDKQQNTYFIVLNFQAAFIMLIRSIYENSSIGQLIVYDQGIVISASSLIILTAICLMVIRQTNNRISLFINTLLITSLWLFFYYLSTIPQNGSQSNTGLRLCFNGVVCALCLIQLNIIIAYIGLNETSMFISYCFSILAYFYTITLVQFLGLVPPCLLFARISHCIFLFFVLTCIWKQFQQKQKQQECFRLKPISANILVKAQKNKQQLTNKRSQTPKDIRSLQTHQCRICLQNPSAYALECKNFYHFCICSQCIEEWLQKFKGKCQICNQVRSVIVRVKDKQNDKDNRANAGKIGINKGKRKLKPQQQNNGGQDCLSVVKIFLVN